MSTELETYIKLKYIPVQHTYEYLIMLPDIVIDEIFYFIGKKPELAAEKNFKELFINEYLIYNKYTNRTYEAYIERIIKTTLWKHYSENPHSIIE